MLQREQDGFVGGGVAGMQRGDDIDRAHFGFRDLAFDKIHAGKAAFGRDLLAPWRSVRAALPPPITLPRPAGAKYRS